VSLPAKCKYDVYVRSVIELEEHIEGDEKEEEAAAIENEVRTNRGRNDIKMTYVHVCLRREIT